MSQSQPRATRPNIPGYGIPEGDEGLLSWSDVQERLERSQHYWMATVRPDGRPHAVPTWGAWLDNAFYTEGGGRKMENLRANPRVVVHLESGAEAVIVEGTAEEIFRPDRELFQRFDAAYAAKYEYKPSDNLGSPDEQPFPEGGLFVIWPHVAFAWTRFPEDATRFLFDG